MANDTELSKRAGHRLIKNQTNQRVSIDAGKELIQEMEEYGKEIAAQAKEFADAAGRKTVREDDIRRALRTLSQN
jgi:histone H3/H4